MTHEEWEEKKWQSFQCMWRYRDFYGDKWKDKWKQDTGMTPEETDAKYAEMEPK